MKDRRDKILDEAIALAEAGGFDNVRQRDVATNAGVSLGTLYKRFRSKEDILVAALERETEELERRMELHPAPGRTSLERIEAFFEIVTKGLCRKPKYARAILRSVVSGEAGVAQKVASYQGRISGLIIAAIRGVGRLGFNEATTSPPTPREVSLAVPLQHIWFAALVGWSAGLLKQTEVVERVTDAARLLLRGLDSEP
jgi:AcrR family transcriptional regulator